MSPSGQKTKLAFTVACQLSPASDIGGLSQPSRAVLGPWEPTRAPRGGSKSTGLRLLPPQPARLSSTNYLLLARLTLGRSPDCFARPALAKAQFHRRYC